TIVDAKLPLPPNLTSPRNCPQKCLSQRSLSQTPAHASRAQAGSSLPSSWVAMERWEWSTFTISPNGQISSSGFRLPNSLLWHAWKGLPHHSRRAKILDGRLPHHV